MISPLHWANSGNDRGGRNRKQQPFRQEFGRNRRDNAMSTHSMGATLVIGSLMAALIWLAGGSDYARPRPFAGDHLGPHTGQTSAEYQQHADESLASALQRAPTSSAYAMLSLTTPLAAAEAGEIFADLQRVGTIITHDGQILATPEPAASASRGEIFQTTLAAALATALTDSARTDTAATDSARTGTTATGSASATTAVVPHDLPQISAVIAFESPENLALLADNPAIATIEVLPADAVWRQFGISPPVAGV